MRLPRKHLNALTTALMLAMCLTSVGLAGTFVSFNGQFTIEYPEGWRQVDYKTADVLLNQIDSELNYEAAFTSTESGMPFDDAYFILEVDTVGQLTQEQIDSIVNEVSGPYGGYDEVSPDSFIATAKDYYAQLRSDGLALALVTDLTEESGEPLKNLFALRFYERGMAKFFFFGPGEEFQSYLQSFHEIFSSFSTDNLEAVLKSEPVRIAELEDKSKSSNLSTYGGIGGFAVIVVIFVIARARKKRQAK